VSQQEGAGDDTDRPQYGQLDMGIVLSVLMQHQCAGIEILQVEEPDQPMAGAMGR
jgi:hypothetical protein